MKLNLLTLISILLYQAPNCAAEKGTDNTTLLPDLSRITLTNPNQDDLLPKDKFNLSTLTYTGDFEDNQPFSLITNANTVTIQGNDKKEIVIQEKIISKEKRDKLLAVGAFFNQEMSLAGFTQKETDLLEYIITVPHSTQVAITNMAGNIFAKNLTAQVKLLTDTGTVQARKVSGHLSIIKAGAVGCIILSQCTGEKNITANARSTIVTQND